MLTRSLEYRSQLRHQVYKLLKKGLQPYHQVVPLYPFESPAGLFKFFDRTL